MNQIQMKKNFKTATQYHYELMNHLRNKKSYQLKVHNLQDLLFGCPLLNCYD